MPSRFNETGGDKVLGRREIKMEREKREKKKKKRYLYSIYDVMKRRGLR